MGVQQWAYNKIRCDRSGGREIVATAQHETHTLQHKPLLHMMLCVLGLYQPIFCFAEASPQITPDPDSYSKCQHSVRCPTIVCQIGAITPFKAQHTYLQCVNVMGLLHLQ